MADNSPQVQQLGERWGTFLDKIQARYNEVLEQSAEPLKETINNLQYDTIIIHNILTALKNQTVQQLTEKIEEGWKKMYGEMNKVGASREELSRQGARGAFVKDKMSVDFRVFEVKTYGDAARKILANVQAHIDETKLHRCTQCGADLPIKVYSFMAVNIKCDSCGSVNTYQPDDRVRALEYYVINNLAEEIALPEKMRAEYDKNAAKEYYRKYYGFLMENVPDKKEFYERDMNERISWCDTKPNYVKDYFSAR